MNDNDEGMAATPNFNYTEFQVQEIIDQARRSVTLNPARVSEHQFGSSKYTYIEITSNGIGGRDCFYVSIKNGRKQEAAIFPSMTDMMENPEAKKFQTSLPKVHQAVCEIAAHDARMINWGMWDEDGNETGKTFDDVRADQEAARAAR